MTDHQKTQDITQGVAKDSLFMVFDVESIGLHGEGFAVGWVVLSSAHGTLTEGLLSCSPDLCVGTPANRTWVNENVAPLEHTSPSREHLLNVFWENWRHWAERGALLVADCSWPVEANFLSACIALKPEEREWQGPYPLHDLASVLLAHGEDPLAITPRRSDELPAHHPLMDARLSARQLLSALSPQPDEPA